MAYREDTFTPWALNMVGDVASWKRTQAKEPSRVRNARIWEALMRGLKEYKADQHFGNIQQDNLDNLIKYGILEADNIKATEQYNLRKPWLDKAQEFGGVHDPRAEHIFEGEAWKRARRANEAFNALHPSEESYPTYASFNRAFQNKEIGEGLHTAMSKLYNAEKDDLIQFARSGKGYDPTVAAARLATLKEMQIDTGDPSLFSLMTGSARRQAEMQDKMIDTYRDDFVAKEILNGAVDYQIFEKNRGDIAQMRVELKDTPLSWVDKVSDDVWEDLSTAPTSIRKGFYDSMQTFTDDSLKTKGEPPTQKELHNQIYQFTIGLAQPSEGLKTRYWKLMADISSVEASQSSPEEQASKIEALIANYEKNKGFFQAMATSEDASKFIRERQASTQAIERIRSQMDDLVTSKQEGSAEYKALERELYILTKAMDFKGSGMSDALTNNLLTASLSSQDREIKRAAREITLTDFSKTPGTFGGFWYDGLVEQRFNKEEREALAENGITWHKSSELPFPGSLEGANNSIAVNSLVANIVNEDLKNRLNDVSKFDLDAMYNNLIHTTKNIVEANNARYNTRDYILGGPIELATAMHILLKATDQNGQSLLNVRENEQTGQKIVLFGGEPEPRFGTIINTLQQHAASSTRKYQSVPRSIGLLEEARIAVDPTKPSGAKRRHIRIADSTIRDAKTSDEEETTISRLTILQNRNAVANYLNERLDLLESNNAPPLIISDFKKVAELKWGVDTGEGWLEEDDEGRFITSEMPTLIPTITTTLLSDEELIKLINEQDRIESIITPAINKLKMDRGRIGGFLVSDLSPENQELLQTQEDLENLLKELEGLKNFEEGLKIREGGAGALTISPRMIQEKERRENNIRNLIQNSMTISELLGRL